MSELWGGFWWSCISFTAAAAKSLQSCPTLCDPIDGSPPGSSVPGTLQARTLEWAAISFSNAWKWSRSVVSDSSQPHGLQPTRLLRPWDFLGKSTGVGCHRFLHDLAYVGNWICGSSALSKSSCTSRSSQFMYCWNLAWRIFEHNLVYMWNECSCAVVWTFFDIILLWDWN